MRTNKQNWAERNAKGQTSKDVAVEVQREANEDKIEIAEEHGKGGKKKAATAPRRAKSEPVANEK